MINIMRLCNQVIDEIHKNFYGIDVYVFGISSEDTNIMKIKFIYEVPKLSIINDCYISFRKATEIDNTLFNIIYKELVEHIFYDITGKFINKEENNDM